MERNKELKISEEDLKFIVKDNFERIIEVAKYNSFCLNCFEKYDVEMVDYQISLNRLNDVIFEGKCKLCNEKIVRHIEIGEERELLLRTEIIRNQKVNSN